MVKINFNKKYTTITLAKPPANAFCLNFLNSILTSFEKIDKEKALIITGEGNIFSAGLDLYHISNIDKQNFKKLISKFEQVLLKIIQHPAQTYTILNGHAIGGGFILLSCTDICLSNSNDYKVGLNHSILNSSLPAVPSAIIKTKYTNIQFFESSITISSLIKTSDFIKIKSNPMNYITNHMERINYLHIREKKIYTKNIMLYLKKYGAETTQNFYNDWWSDKLVDARNKFLKKLKQTKN